MALRPFPILTLKAEPTGGSSMQDCRVIEQLVAKMSSELGEAREDNTPRGRMLIVDYIAVPRSRRKGEGSI